MAAVPYLLNRQTKAGRPSVYCRVQHRQTLTFDDLCQHAAHTVHLPPAMLRAYIQATLDEAYRLVKQGFRVELGDRCLSLYAQVRKAVPVEVDEETGEILWPASSEDIIPQGRDGRVECEVHKRLNRRFRSEVHWERAKYNNRRQRRK